MGKPAATISHFHVCPKVTAKVPHVGGPVIQGSPNVTIGGLPAARVGDTLICVGPPDKIKKGSSSVFINGKEAARMGDSTDHGGVIVMGNPTVIIGDSPWRGPNEDTLPSYPKSRAEVMQRMDAATTKVQQARASGAPLPKSPYTTEDKLFVTAGGLVEKFLVRVIKTDYASVDGTIGYLPKGATSTTYWTTTYTQAEHGDHDAELLCRGLGINYDPKCSYTLLLIDAEAAYEQGDMVSMIPDYENLSAFAQQEIAGKFPGREHLIPDAMTPEYSQHYEQVKQEADARGVDMDDPDDLKNLCMDLGLNSDQARRLGVRHQLNQQLGANEHFLGNGLTKDTAVHYPETPFGAIDQSIQYGPVETFTRDKNPRTLGELERVGIVTRIPLTSY
ncbi:MAG: PAAR domain-containing protein [Gammaproteobacteria bacterium]|nr:PAAR domain-containing protein [Gammaproteobacteria bacterium]